MSSPLDKVLPAKVARIIATYGRTATLRSVTRSYNIGKDQVTFGTPTNTTIKCTPPSSCTLEFLSAAGEGGQVKVFGFTTLVSPISLTTTIKPNEDRLIISSTSYLIVRVDPIYCGDKIAAYKLYLNGGEQVPSQ